MLDESESLSAGQKQLLTIARAMAKNAPMLILDEATSSVDTRTELDIQKAMDALMERADSFSFRLVLLSLFKVVFLEGLERLL
jgi:ATP-binding cassette subfamily B multidrug efflux pump